jgi:hypothetical protein
MLKIYAFTDVKYQTSCAELELENKTAIENGNRFV